LPELPRRHDAVSGSRRATIIGSSWLPQFGSHRSSASLSGQQGFAGKSFSPTSTGGEPSRPSTPDIGQAFRRG